MEMRLLAYGQFARSVLPVVSIRVRLGNTDMVVNPQGFAIITNRERAADE